MQLDLGSILALGLIVGLFLLGWRANRAPGTDRALLRDHGQLKGRVAALEEGLKSCSTRADAARIESKIEALERYAASAGDINALEGKVNVALANIDAIERAAQRTEEGVRRIEGFFIQKGIER